MRIRCLWLLPMLGCSLFAGTETLPPQKLLPKDTVMVITMPDSAKGLATFTNTSLSKLWADPALKPFKDKFNARFDTAVVDQLENELGIKFADYKGLAQGQLTYALVPSVRADKPDDHYASVMLLDTRDHADQLATNLAAVKKKWIDAGKTLKTDKIRDIDFTTLMTTSDELSMDKLLPKLSDTNGADALIPKPPVEKVELIFGQSGPLLIVSQSRDVIEKVLARQAGGLVPGLDEQPAFAADYLARLQTAPAYAWFNAKSLVADWGKQRAAEAGDTVVGAVAGGDATLTALGLTGLTSASVACRETPDGMELQLFIGAPEGDRHGILQVLETGAKDASPPPFVPADAVKFTRMRLDMPKSWRLLEIMLGRLSPQFSQLFNFILDSAGKDKDEKYDLRAELMASLGDDIITYQKNPLNNTLGDLKSAPTLYLIGSPKPEKLAAAVKVALGLVIQGPTDIKDREFLGRKIYSLTMPMSPQGGSHSFHFAASGGYVAMTGDLEMLEEYLRSGDGKTKGLNEMPGLAEAAQKAGGMNTGIFSFSNDRETMRAEEETLRKEPVGLSDIFALMGFQSQTKISTLDDAQRLKEWADFSLLPPFDALSKYFNYSVWVGRFSPDGFTLNCFTPTSPQLR